MERQRELGRTNCGQCYGQLSQVALEQVVRAFLQPLSTIVSADLSFSIQSSSPSERRVRRLLCPLVQQLQRVVALLPDCVKSVIAQGQADGAIFTGRMRLDHIEDARHTLDRIAGLLLMDSLYLWVQIVDERLVLIDVGVNVDRLLFIEELSSEVPGLDKERPDSEWHCFQIQTLDRG